MNTDFKWLVEVFKDGLSLPKDPGYIIDEILTLNEYLTIDPEVDECGSTGYLIDNPINNVDKILDIAVDECGNIYLIDNTSNQIFLYNIQKQVLNPLKCLNKELKSFKEFKPLKKLAISPDTLFVADDELAITFARANGQLRSISRISDLDEKIPINGDKLPAEIDLPRLGVQKSGFTQGLDGNYYLIIKNGKNKIVRLKYEKNRYLPKKCLVKVFDSRDPTCMWHRLELNADIPVKTHIDIYYHISNDENLGNVEWKKLVTFQSDVNLYDVLIPKVQGRFLRIKIDLFSTDEFKTPTIRQFKVYFPRISYLRYLPAVYQEDEASKEFLERFLSLFETFMWKKEEQIDDISRYFDADSAPEEFLTWLGSWTSTVFDESWSLDKKRMFLKNAVKLYKKRGTKEGLEELLEIYTGNKPIIVENWQLYGAETNCQSPLKCKNNSKNISTINEENSSDLEDLFGKPAPFHFCVISIPYLYTIDSTSLDKLEEGPVPDKFKAELLKRDIQISDGAEISHLRDNEWLIEGKENFLTIDFDGSFKIYRKPFINVETLLKTFMRLIDREKPAHTTAGVVILQPWMYLGMHTYLGVNSFLSKNDMRLGTGTAINRDTVLAEKEKSGQLNVKSRVEIDTKLS